MPELDAAILCDYVRPERAMGVSHLMAAGMDRIHAEEVPTGQNVGLYVRFHFERVECGRPHRVEIILQGEDGDRLAQIDGTITPEWQDEWPAGWKAGAALSLNLGIPLPKWGIYSFEILINDSHKKSIPLMVVEASSPSTEGDGEPT